LAGDFFLNERAIIELQFAHLHLCVGRGCFSQKFFFGNIRFRPIIQNFIFSRKITVFTDYTENSVFLPNIRFRPNIQNFIFSRKITDFTDYNE
jgi:hypothetical protein